MKTVYFNGELNVGCGGAAYIQGASVNVPDDYTMTQLVNAIKEAGYISFMTDSMKKLVRI